MSSAVTSAPASVPDEYTKGLPKYTNPDPSPEDVKRRKRTERAWKAYRGDYPDTFKIDPGMPNLNIAPNRCAAIVDKGVAWLFGQPIELDVRMAADDEREETRPGRPMPTIVNAEPPDNAKMQAALAKVWGNPDDMIVLLTGLAMNGAMDGHAYLKIVWDSEKMDYPRLSVLDSNNVYVIADPDDCNSAMCYVIEYKASMGVVQGQLRIVTKRQVICRVDPDGNARLLGGYDDDDTWTICNYWRVEASGGTGLYSTSSMSTSQQQGANWSQIGKVVEWPYPFPPIVDCGNLPNPNEYYGLPDLPPALINLNERIHFVESNVGKIIQSHAHPWVFASGCDPSAIRNEPGVVQGLPSTDSKVWAVSATGDLASSMTFASSLRADMDEQSRVPAVALGRQEELPKGNISGVALALLFQPLIEKTELKRRLYGRLIRCVSQCALVLLGQIEDCDDVDVHVKWPNLLPVDDLAAAQTAQLLTQIGVSQATVLAQLGYDPDEEAEQTGNEQAAKMTAQSKGQAPMGNVRPMPQRPGAPGQRPGLTQGALSTALPTGNPPTPTLAPNSTVQAAAQPPMIAPAAGQ
jgi:Phage portal protein, SPP1 Gp6-like